MNQIWLEVLLFVLSVLFVLLGVLGLPGNFFPVLVSLLAVLAGDGISFTWTWFIVFLLIAASGEVVDQLTGVLGARRFGATRPGMLGAAVGGIAGALLGTLVLPVIGSMVGMFIGCFALTFLFELVFSGRTADEGRKAGIGAVIGKAAATAYKFFAGFVLLILMSWRFWGISV